MQEYAATYQYGGTTVHIVAPQITEEENERRWKEVYRVIWSIWMAVQSR